MEKKEKLGQEPAFPLTHDNMVMATVRMGVNPGGMTIRFYAACAAMQGFLSCPGSDIGTATPKEIVELSYKYADELLKQESDE